MTKPHSFPADLGRVAYALCEAANTPRALTVAILMKHGEWDQLASLSCRPVDYVGADAYYQDAVVTAFLKKNADLPTSVDRKAKAVNTFYENERKCCRTNLHLRRFLEEGDLTLEDIRVVEFINQVKKVVRSVLGPIPKQVKGYFGPGSTFGDRGLLATVPDKMSSHPTLYERSWPWLTPWIPSAWARALSRYPYGRREANVVRGNRFTTVPKTALTERGIAVEASISSFYQLGVGRHIRGRLARFGIDLSHGKEVHARLAQQASLDGKQATLDMSNASDLISYKLVELLLPKEWFDFLNTLRAPATLIEGKWVRLEKFSSMGNGFTFELETLIFWSIACVASRERFETAAFQKTVLAYGDDLIVPTESARDVIAALEFFGMVINKAKSFVEGPFRESCGGDFFAGQAVRPHFVKENPYEPQHWIALANGIRRVGNQDVPGFPSLSRYHRPWLRALDNLPTAIRCCRGPEELGDTVIADDPSYWSTRWRRSVRYIRCFKPARHRRVGWEHFVPEVVLASALYGGCDEKGGEFPPRGVTPRDSVEGYRIGYIPYS